MSEWKLVPVEPTEAMMDAAEACSGDWPRTTWKEAWTAMLAAVPPPVAQEPAAFLCEWDDPKYGWRQYHDETDPLPAEWDSGPPTRITPLYAAPAVAQPQERSAKDYAIEHAEYMATAAEAFIEAIGIETMARESVENDDEDADVAMESSRENVSETNRGLVEAIYEFRKRKDRALAAPVREEARPAVAQEARDAALEAENKRLRTALRAAVADLTCGDDGAHYCPRCDNSLFNARRAAESALKEQP